MNIFRLTGDLSHLLAIIILLRKIWKTRSCAGAKCILVNGNEVTPTPDIHKSEAPLCKKALTVHPKSMIHQQALQTPLVDIDSLKTASKKCDEFQLINPINLTTMQIERQELVNPRLNDDAPTRCQGISGKSQILFAVVYTTRYLDLLTAYVSMYNTLMKLVFIAASYATCYFIYIKFKATYDHNHDTFRIEFLLVPAVILSLLINHDFTILEVLWTFSIYLESVAILPQLFMVSKTGEAESITSHYLFALGSYRGLYILNWIYRYVTEEHYDLIAIVAGIVQTVLYCDFFYLYITKVLRGKKLQLPA